jgi:hypothetical protein
LKILQEKIPLKKSPWRKSRGENPPGQNLAVENPPRENLAVENLARENPPQLKSSIEKFPQR